jgi:hypothetical protein
MRLKSAGPKMRQISWKRLGFYGFGRRRMDLRAVITIRLLNFVAPSITYEEYP